MDKNIIAFSVICIAAVLLAGCTGSSPSTGGGTTSNLPSLVVTTAPAVSATKIPATSLYLTASPRQYSPLMSSTVGIGIEVNASGFDPASALFTWNATYGKFLLWGPVNFTVQDKGTSVTNHGEKIYWSFFEKPASATGPVIITVTATDPASGKILGNSTLKLVWEEGLMIKVDEIR